jgi:acylphosphatase
VASARFLVSGLVQGVSFRAWTQARAQELDLQGYAGNLPDGRVEVVATGQLHTLAQLEAWLRQGPPAAEVESVLREDLAEQRHDGFARR